MFGDRKVLVASHYHAGCRGISWGARYSEVSDLIVAVTVGGAGTSVPERRELRIFNYHGEKKYPSGFVSVVGLN